MSQSALSLTVLCHLVAIYHDREAVTKRLLPSPIGISHSDDPLTQSTAGDSLATCSTTSPVCSREPVGRFVFFCVFCFFVSLFFHLSYFWYLLYPYIYNKYSEWYSDFAPLTILSYLRCPLQCPDFRRPRDVAADWVTGNIYWTDHSRMHWFSYYTAHWTKLRYSINVGQLKGPNCTRLITDIAGEPYAITVNPVRGWDSAFIPFVFVSAQETRAFALHCAWKQYFIIDLTLRFGVLRFDIFCHLPFQFFNCIIFSVGCMLIDYLNVNVFSEWCTGQWLVTGHILKSLPWMGLCAGFFWIRDWGGPQVFV